MTQGTVHLVAGILAVGLLLLAGVFYPLTLQRTLEKCAAGSRTLSPGLVWLMLIPLFNLALPCVYSQPPA
jgi:hypothetical protein